MRMFKILVILAFSIGVVPVLGWYVTRDQRRQEAIDGEVFAKCQSMSDKLCSPATTCLSFTGYFTEEDVVKVLGPPTMRELLPEPKGFTVKEEHLEWGCPGSGLCPLARGC
jgi:hypothetical protein